MSKKIMLVEDDTNLREIYGARLMAEGYQIVSAQDGEAALAMAVKERPDLIISDVMMPKISGFDMLDILRSTPETKDTKVVMMTALSQAEDKTRADELGADKYLVKSQVTLEDVARVVHELLEDEPPITVPGSDSTEQTPEEPPTSTPAEVSTEPSEDAETSENPLPQITPEAPAVASAAPVAQDVPIADEPDDQTDANSDSDDSDDNQATSSATPSAPAAPTSIAVQDDSDDGSSSDETQNPAAGPIDSGLAAAESQAQAAASTEERAELGDQIADAMQKDMSTAPREVPVTTEPPAETPAEEPAQSDGAPEPVGTTTGRKVIEPLQSNEPHVTQLAAEEEQREAQSTPGAEFHPAETPAEPEPNVPQAPAQPDKYTIQEPPSDPEESDPNAIAL